MLRRQPGESFDAGLINGPRGKGTIRSIDDRSITLSFAWDGNPPPLAPIHLLIGLPRPQTARDILREATSLGIASIGFVRSEKGEAGYADSSLWRTSQWQDHLIQGAAQAFCTRLPIITHYPLLSEAIAGVPAQSQRLILDNYEAPVGLSQCPVAHDRPVVLALGSERGWSAKEREAMRAAGFVFVHLGTRVLRTETACIAAVTLLKAKLGLL